MLLVNDTYCSPFSHSLFFCFVGEAGKKGGIISVRFGEQMWQGNSEGALFWWCLPMFDQEHIGPRLDRSPASCRDSAPTGEASDKMARAFWKSEHSPHGREVPSKLTTQSFNT